MYYIQHVSILLKNYKFFTLIIIYLYIFFNYGKKKKKNFATVVTDITKLLILRILSLSSSCYPVRAQRAHFLGDKLSTTPRHSTQNDARMALSFQKL